MKKIGYEKECYENILAGKIIEKTEKMNEIRSSGILYLVTIALNDNTNATVYINKEWFDRLYINHYTMIHQTEHDIFALEDEFGNLCGQFGFEERQNENDKYGRIAVINKKKYGGCKNCECNKCKYKYSKINSEED